MGKGILDELAGSLPAGWKLLPLKRVAAIRYGLGQPPPFLDGGTPLLRATNVTRGLITDAGLIYVDPTGVPPGRDARLRAGEIIVVRSGAYTGDSAIVPSRFDQALTGYDMVVRSISINERFLAWQLLADHILNYQFSLVKSRAAQPHLNAEDLGETLIAVPSPKHQNRIAAFLDRETAKIDALIAKQTEFLTRLEEHRRALITEAVTCGLDPLVPMQTTGNDLVPIIPKHWKLMRLRHVATVQHGLALGKKTDEPTTEVAYIRVANVQDGYLDLQEIKTVPATAEEIRRHALQPGDVLMNEGGDNDKLGRGAIWIGQVKDCIHQNHVFAVRPHGVEPEWLTAVTGVDYAKRFFETRAKQSTNLASISSSNLREVPIVVPPAPERAAILRAILIKTMKVDILREKSASAVALLQERRAALITAAVTGQIDVTQPTLTEAAA